MSKPFHIQVLKQLFIALFAFFLQPCINAQEASVIDNKGNIVKVRNNVVTISNTAPTSPLEGDVWFDNTDPNNRITSIWDGTAWQEVIHEGVSGSLFFAATDGRPIEDNSQLFWDDANNRLGIGTNSPTTKLQVEGTIRSQGILNSNGTVGEPSYSFNGDTNTGIFSPTADEMGISVGGIEAIRIDETSNNTTVTINETLDLDGPVLDENDAVGTAGQVLIATTTGTAWSSQLIDAGSSPVKAFGKISSAGAVVKATTGVSALRISTGRYRVTLVGVVTDSNYIIQLTQPGRGGTGLIGGDGNDDPGISYANQDATGFDIIIGDNDNGGTDRSRFNSEFMFTILDL